jgi:hypothetical protein
MVAPLNYMLNVASPFEQAVQGLKLGATVAELQAKQQQDQIGRASCRERVLR